MSIFKSPDKQNRAFKAHKRPFLRPWALGNMGQDKFRFPEGAKLIVALEKVEFEK